MLKGDNVRLSRDSCADLHQYSGGVPTDDDVEKAPPPISESPRKIVSNCLGTITLAREEELPCSSSEDM